MTDTEVYDKFFIDEEYDLDNSPKETYSYRSGWNDALKRASIVVRKEIRPQGEWLTIEDRNGEVVLAECSKCRRTINVTCGKTLADYPFCHCGADMRKGGRE